VKQTKTSLTRRTTGRSRDLLLHVNSALAVEPVTAPAPAPAQAIQSRVPFEQLQLPSRNPIYAYHGKAAPPRCLRIPCASTRWCGRQVLPRCTMPSIWPSKTISDSVIARYNLPIAQMDILRTEAGGQVRRRGNTA